MDRRSSSETLTIGLLLTFAGGFLEAYTYMLRGGVFCNAQTGNVALMTLYLIRGDVKQGLYYPIPILAFFAGILLAVHLSNRLKSSRFRWKSILILIEAATLILIGFVPLSAPNAVANVTISFICAIQFESFRVTGGLPYASTFLTGNLRLTAEHLYQWVGQRDRQAKGNFLRYLAVIAVFALGVLVGALAAPLGAKSIWICSGVLLAAFALMEFWDQRV